MSSSSYWSRAILILPLITVVPANSSVVFAGGCPSAKTRNAAATQFNEPRVKMAFVGGIDVDGDGVSDRQHIYEHLEAAGAKVIIEVDDNGVRRPENRKIDSRIKFLVVGELIDPETVTDPARRKIAKRVAQHFLALRAEARKAGVRTVNIGDFFAFGSPWRNRWRPSMPGSFKRSPGKTSDIYQRSKRLKQPKSIEQTSKLFGGGSPYDKQVDMPE